MPTSTVRRPLAFVTGASNGIGTEVALELANRGYDIIGTGRSDSIDTVAEGLRALGATVYPLRADLGTYDGVENLWKQVHETGRSLDIAVLNAGISIGGAFATDTDLDDELNLIALNINAVVHLAKRVVPDMLARGAGRILITSSISATTPTPYETVYGPSKAFGYSFAESLREELRGTGVTVTALLPGATDSDFHARAGMGQTSIGKGRKNDKRLVAKQGVDALLAGKDHVVGGDRATQRTAFLNRFLPEPVKARRQGANAKP
ncbi:SDR family NAD(P)-dependent oxidoreductase [Streptomyces sp. NPDC005962]|uniref:SDR family NAD(P)-dependent oxidoreductase n=1 Tax=Streptomyces sp. NPDC005962 TaxID=3154466 RepID=UPI0033C57EA9